MLSCRGAHTPGVRGADGPVAAGLWQRHCCCRLAARRRGAAPGNASSGCLAGPPAAIRPPPGHRPSLRLLATAGGHSAVGGGGWGGGGGGKGGGGDPGRSTRGDGPERPGRSLWAILLVSASAATVGIARTSVAGDKDIGAKSHGGTNHTAKLVTIIIPVLNEGKTIEQTLRYLSLLRPQPAEIIVVDGGSTDNTAELVRRQGVKLLRSGKGRGRQMNEGAAAATGEILCFLHADTLPPLNLVALASETLASQEVVLGGFFPLIQVPDRVLWFSSLHNAASTWYAPMLFRPLSFLRGLRLLFGDQVQFCRRSEFRSVGGFDSELIIMEDADLCIRMHMGARADGQRGRVKMLPTVVQTSGRRIDSWGALRSTWIQVQIALIWYLGGSPEDLRRAYNRIYTDRFR